jgi:cell division transport system permease protein
MTRNKVLLLVCFLVAFAAGIAAGNLIAAKREPPRRHHSFLKEELKLTPEQQEQMGKIWSEVTEAPMKQYREQRQAAADERDKALAALPAAAFPASLEVGFSDEVSDDELSSMALKLRALPAVETVETYQRWTERLSSLLGGGVTASACLAVIVLCAVVSVIGSTMRLLLHRRKSEVEVLKLVGATDAFVRRPFVVEGATEGAAGAAAALLMLGVLFLIVRGRFDQELSTLLGVTPSFLPWHLALAMVALGGTLGALTALISLRKMVKI